MPKEKEKKEVAIIWWEDSAIHCLATQLNSSEVKEYESIEIVSAGVISHETKKFITLAVDWFDKNQKTKRMNFDEDQFRQISSIPKSCIRKIKRIKIFS